MGAYQRDVGSDLVLSEEQIRRWMLNTIRHSITVEHILQELDAYDPQSPHDLEGLGNKFEWQIMAPLAAAESIAESYANPAVSRAIHMHRTQVHHQAWHNPDEPGPYWMMDPEKALILGAVDSIASLMEYREYQGGPHTMDEVAEFFQGNGTQRRYVRAVLDKVSHMSLPDVNAITSLDEIETFGLRSSTSSKLLTIVSLTRDKLSYHHGYSV